MSSGIAAICAKRLAGVDVEASEAGPAGVMKRLESAGEALNETEPRFAPPRT
jgi:hypothetical protein